MLFYSYIGGAGFMLLRLSGLPVQMGQRARCEVGKQAWGEFYSPFFAAYVEGIRGLSL